jgi:hypothetical protein
VERGDRRRLARIRPGLDGELLGDLGDGDALVLQRNGEGEHVVVDDLRAAAVVAFGRCGDLAFEGLLPDVVAFDPPGDGEDGEEHGAHAVGVVNPGERAGEEFELDAAGLELGGQRHQLGRVAREALERVHREDGPSSFLRGGAGPPAAAVKIAARLLEGGDRESG